MRFFSLALALLCLALPATAQTVSSDLNSDGKPERFILITRDGLVDLHIENTGGDVVIAQGIAWSGGIGQKPELARAPNGSVLLRSMNDSIGRNRWHLTLTIAHRQGAYKVVGYTYDWYDTLDLANSGKCDLNLLTGRGFLTKGNSAKTSVQTSLRPIPVTDFKDDHPIPDVCGVN